MRAVVSAPKQAYHDSQNWLDLSYITPRLIVAAGPTDNFLNGIFRSPIDKVVAHLNQCYKTGDQTHWHIWNLRGEGPGYSRVEDDNWSYHPFPDHLPPSITLLNDIVKAIDSFLRASPNNVALIHCKEGKGRSGTVCCAYLMYEAKQRGVYMTVDEAIAAFTRRRMRKHFGNGVSILSQVRYLHYWKRYLQFSPEMRANCSLYHVFKCAPFNVENSRLAKITIVKPTPMAALSKLNLCTYVERDQGLEVTPLFTETLLLAKMKGGSTCLDLQVNIPIASHVKDVRVSFERQLVLSYAWFNLYFESLSGFRPLPTDGPDTVSRTLTLTWEQFDGYKGTKCNRAIRLFDRVDVEWVYQYGPGT